MENPDSQPVFHWADYVVFAGSLLVCILIALVQGVIDKWGIKQSKKDAASAEAGKYIGAVPAVLSSIATTLSSNFVLGVPAEIYYVNTDIFLVGVGLVVGSAISVALFIRKFYALKLVSVFEYVQQRFSKPVSHLLTFVFTVIMILYMGIILYGPALALGQAADISDWVAVLSTGCICIVYTLLGGLRGVLWIDTLQMMVVLVLGLVNVGKGAADVGGLTKVWDIGLAGDRLTFPSWSPDPTIRHSFWTTLVGGTALIMTYFNNQALTQKFLGLKSMKHVIYVGIAFAASYLVMIVVFVLSGLVMYAYYSSVGCEPTQRGLVKNVDQMVVYYVLDIYRPYPGISGLFVAGVYGASLSSVAAGINALAAITQRDIVGPLYKKKTGSAMTDPVRGVMVFKGLTLFWGLVVLAVAFVSPYLGTSVLQIGLSLFGWTMGPIVGIILLGFWVPFAETIGAIVGGAVGLVFCLFVGIGAVVTAAGRPVPSPLPTGVCYSPNVTMPEFTLEPTTSPFTTLGIAMTSAEPTVRPDWYAIFEISYLLYALFGILIVLIIGTPVSLCVQMARGWRFTVDSRLGMGRCFKTCGKGDDEDIDEKEPAPLPDPQEAADAEQLKKYQSAGPINSLPIMSSFVYAIDNPAFEKDGASNPPSGATSHIASVDVTSGSVNGGMGRSLYNGDVGDHTQL